jgi:aspartokinase
MRISGSGFMAAPEQAGGEIGAAQDASVHFEKERGVTEVRILRGLAHVTVRFPEPASQGRLALLQALAEASISIFLVKLHPGAISFAVRQDVVDPCERLLRERDADFSMLRDLGLLTTVAGAMRDLSGVMARMYGAMLAAGIGLRQTGDAHNAVLCLVPGEETDRAADALRQAFALSETTAAPPAPPPPRDNRRRRRASSGTA